jgi:hypothetical protein
LNNLLAISGCPGLASFTNCLALFKIAEFTLLLNAGGAGFLFGLY